MRTLLLTLLFLTPALQAQTLSVTAAATPGGYAGPLDAAPDPEGDFFYFTASGPGGASVFKVAAAGGPLTAIAAGAPLVSPVGLVVSGDGARVYVADPRAYAAPGRVGQVFVIAANGGAVRTLPAAAGLQARVLDVVSEGGQDVLFFAGRNGLGQPAIYRLAVGEAQAAPLFQGAPLVEPGGIVVSRGGDVYIADQGDHPFGGAVYRLRDGALTTVVESMRAGDPAGIALTLDESALLVSALQTHRRRAQVLVVDLATLETQAVTAVVGQHPAAGGLHRARLRDVFAWADSEPPGVVYRVRK